MNFQDIAKTFAESTGGTDQFKELFKSASELMKSDPDNAALYFVVTVAARAYVKKYEDQGVEADLSLRAKTALDDFNARIVSALSQDAGQRLRAASSIALNYEWHVVDF